MNIDDLDLELTGDPVVINPGDAARARVVAAALARDGDDLAELLDVLGIGGRVVAFPGPTLAVAITTASIVRAAS